MPIIRKLRIDRDATTWTIQGELRRFELRLFVEKFVASNEGSSRQRVFARNVEFLLYSLYFSGFVSLTIRSCFLEINKFHKICKVDNYIE